MDTIRATVVSELQTALSAITSKTESVQSLVIALSGGKDSVVLLDIISRLVDDTKGGSNTLPSIYAFHVNHGLSSDAEDWEQHCAHICAHRNIPFQSCAVTITPKPRTSLEAQARELRYQRLVEFTKQVKGAIVTAHHLHDQMETMLLQLKRGAGPRGLACMQLLSYKEQVPIIRPMLAIAQDAVNQYANTKRLSWVEDASNKDERYDRNFLRQQIIPQLQARWPAISAAIARSAQHCHEQAVLLEQVCREKLCTLQDAERRLDVVALTALSEMWQKQILREWLRQFFPLSPSTAVLAQIQTMLTAREDSQPLVEMSDYSVRRFRGKLWCVSRFSHLPEQLSIPEAGLNLPMWEKTLCVNWPDNTTSDRAHITLVTGMPAIKFRPLGKLHNKRLKEWLKEWEVPPWERIQVPIIFFKETPVAVCLQHEILVLQTPPDIPPLDFTYK
ncbi:tRNA lysidine(34) synthetase TilS [Alteromonas ponticola]|uniref:tRNA(Ile)-lysidine synthase n=1 Tax=Alteromonas aquimaris TaxID=2998417 RepID=A0ABT3P461_9ALTE|nr:tRNA lysidine(34) synthetase TilS [Alteromonas aquimaris]MCW8107558.1 tRNA lysidine(34) synthetase TilS [Alteromonas aquimaris]